MKALKSKNAVSKEERDSQSRAPQLFPSGRLGLRLAKNAAATMVFRLGGLLVLLSIIGIVVVLLSETAPLFFGSSVSLKREIPGSLADGATVIAGSVDESASYSWTLDSFGVITTSTLDETPAENQYFDVGSRLMIASKTLDPKELVALTKSNELVAIKVLFETTFVGSNRVITPGMEVGEPVAIEAVSKVKAIASSKDDSALHIAVLGSGGVEHIVQKEKKSLLGGVTKSENRRFIPIESPSAPATITMSHDGRFLFVGHLDGSITILEPTRGIEEALVFKGEAKQSSVSSLAVLLGNGTLVSGYASGKVRAWNILTTGNEGVRLLEKGNFDAHTSPIVGFSASRRNKGFVSAALDGSAKLHYSTSQKTLASLEVASPISVASISAKADHLLLASPTGEKSVFTIDNQFPEATFETLFTPVLYEGRTTPEYVWQSTGGTDAFEPKLSLIPLIFGTLKGTFFALLFALPLSITAALYTSQFMTPKLRGTFKPIVELLAAIPSVVIGFLAGLWLSPRLETYLVSIVVFLPMFVVGCVLLASLRKRIARLIPFFGKATGEMALLILTVFGICLLTHQVALIVEAQFFGGDVVTYLRENHSILYDQRNSIVVGIAMGLAVIPIIFTVSEDCISSVPKPLVAASLALGATPWQTALRVVLPSASPGIFSAVMIGLGRAIGETMIVLMATGNTPILDWSAFNGFRALSANIAVELPEAPHGATLYRVLFLSALLLFVMTLVINTLSELVRIRLRKKYVQS